MDNGPDRRESWLRKLLSSIGPGFITGAADDDPSGIATYSQTGVSFGYGQLWLALFSLPFMIAMQEMCGRIGLITGSGLSGIIKKYYSQKVLYGAVFLLLIANTINIGADLGAMAASMQLLVPVPFFALLIIVTLFVMSLEVMVPYPTYAKFLKYLTFSLLAYIVTALIVKPDWVRIIAATVVPHVALSKDYILNIAAMLGTTISPYLFFWQADEEVEEEIERGEIKNIGAGVPHFSRGDLSQMRADTTLGMIFSQIITFFIIVTSAATLGKSNITTITSAAQAAEALRPIAGNFAFLLFTLGIIGTGLLAVPVLAGSAGYAIAEAMHWKLGLGKRFNRARGFYLVIICATLIGFVVNLTPINPILMLYYSAMLNGVLAPPLMILILLIGNNKKILGNRTNSNLSNVFGGIITIIMSVVSLAFLYSVL